MTLILELSPELERQIHELAQKNGMSAQEFALQSLQERLDDERPPEPKRVFGAARGLIHVPADFDQTPEEFADYL